MSRDYAAEMRGVVDTTHRCRTCAGPLDAFLIERGEDVHPTCERAPEPILPVLAGVLERHQSGSDRSRQKMIGPSQIGDPCDRALAYRLLGVEPARDEGLKWAPYIGTWVHAGIAEAFTQENQRLGRQRYLVEQRITVSEALGIHGVADLFDDDTKVNFDWKVVGKTSLTDKRRHGPGEVYRVQSHLYGLGWHNAGRTPREVRVVFLPKWSVSVSDGYEWSEPWRPEVAEAALRRLQRITYLGGALGVANEPRNWGLIPATVGDGCTWCSWRRPGGPPDGTGCPGNTEDAQRRSEASFARGLVA